MNLIIDETWIFEIYVPRKLFKTDFVLSQEVNEDGLPSCHIDGERLPFPLPCKVIGTLCRDVRAIRQVLFRNEFNGLSVEVRRASAGDGEPCAFPLLQVTKGERSSIHTNSLMDEGDDILLADTIKTSLTFADAIGFLHHLPGCETGRLKHRNHTDGEGDEKEKRQSTEIFFPHTGIFLFLMDPMGQEEEEREGETSHVPIQQRFRKEDYGEGMDYGTDEDTILFLR